MNLFICNTPIHIIKSIQMKQSVLEFSDDADIIVATNYSGAEIVAANLRKTKVFSNVVLYNTEKYSKNAIIKLKYGCNEVSRILRSKKYSNIVSFNIESAPATVAYSLQCKNKGLKYRMVEDATNGHSLYEPPNRENEFVRKLLCIKTPYYHIEDWWFTVPEMVQLPGKRFPLKRLPSLNCVDSEFINIVNRVFDYSINDALENVDILIMEESYFTDKVWNREVDYSVFNRIRKEFPDKHVLVKLHPRTKENRFTQGFQVLENTFIPWEVYLLNMLNSKKRIPIQIGIVCSTLVSDKNVFNAEVDKIVLAKMFRNELKYAEGTIKYFEDLKSQYYDKNKLFMPESIEELLNYLHMKLD